MSVTTVRLRLVIAVLAGVAFGALVEMPPLTFWALAVVALVAVIAIIVGAIRSGSSHRSS